MSSTHRLLVRAIPIDMPRRTERARFDPRRAPLRRREPVVGRSERRAFGTWLGVLAVLAALLFASLSCIEGDGDTRDVRATDDDPLSDPRGDVVVRHARHELGARETAGDVRDDAGDALVVSDAGNELVVTDAGHELVVTDAGDDVGSDAGDDGSDAGDALLDAGANCAATDGEVAFEGRGHVDGPVAYAHNPPASGAHWDIWAAYRAHDVVVAREVYVHNLEHGAIVFLARDDSVAESVRAVFAQVPLDDACVQLGYDHPRALFTVDPLLDDAVAVVAWNRVLTAPCMNDDTAAAMLAFALDHRGDGPEDECLNGWWQP